MFRIRRPSPALVVAMVALFAALGGTAIGAAVVPLAKRALSADNAKKLGGKTPAQVAATPGPASSIASLVTIKTAAFSLTPNQVADFTVACDSGQKVVAGGWTDTTNNVFGLDTRPGSDAASWVFSMFNISNANPGSGTVYALCVR
jgi:hypothetical protein